MHLRLSGKADQEDVEELRLLAESAGAEVCETITGSRDRPDAATFVGKGKAQEIQLAAARHGAQLALVNHALTPSQERNLEKAVGCRVLDRTGLILDIFAQRARSAEGKLQVELAQLEHLSTRLIRGWTHLERQKGGIGLRGPGETQLEVDRRLIRDRIKKLHERLARVSTQRRNRRKARLKVPIPTASLVGYTNAGKSSLFNRLTAASVYSADQLFATLDPTMRRLELPGNLAVILADTVGFIRHLPHDLVEAFKSTLEEVAEASLLLHVVDSSSPERLEQIEQVNRVLSEIHAEAIPQILVFNKIDLTGERPRIERDASGRTRVWLSAKTGAGVELLIEVLTQHYRRKLQRLRLRLPPQAGRLRALLYERAEVLRETLLDSGECEIEAAFDPDRLAWFTRQPDFHAEYLLPDEQRVLAPTGSCP
ncbi:MAG: GTPase HflX [Candidatus Muproteobacteria bacterium RBG_16_65_34]|uniref:GTPase HflX n=1 Tax=Candidatus Muproteobacteria bacterium RBG_16_65_34 TaxID=1817760 RepID=A0A1F6TKN0_9PROT|nr:MAG: GTPase HflX [Candidatus Muproteobacteria bacterium RBG_16_65_34]